MKCIKENGFSQALKNKAFPFSGKPSFLLSSHLKIIISFEDLHLGDQMCKIKCKM